MNFYTVWDISWCTFENTKRIFTFYKTGKCLGKYTFINTPILLVSYGENVVLFATHFSGIYCIVKRVMPQGGWCIYLPRNFKELEKLLGLYFPSTSPLLPLLLP